MNKNDMSGSAFPSHGTMGEVVQEGMTLRDYFAAAALPAIIQSQTRLMIHVGGSVSVSECVARAFDHADAMLSERTK